MVAIIHFIKSVQRPVRYNERKVEKGQAECLLAQNYLRDVADMTIQQKILLLQKRNDLNERCLKKTLHISLNFHPSENLSRETLADIATTFLHLLGFQRQPALVYRHFDAAHPHLHIISNIIRADGRRIETYYRKGADWDKVRLEVENRFGLMKAKGHAGEAMGTVNAISKIHYGKDLTAKSIATTVAYVCDHYQFCSLSEFNAVLRQFNVSAITGKDGGRIHRHAGLLYLLLNNKGKRASIPIKASLLPSKPTLSFLKSKFSFDEELKAKTLEILKKDIDKFMGQPSIVFGELAAILDMQNTYVMPVNKSNGTLAELIFVDNTNKIVLNGSELGAGYSSIAYQNGVHSLSHTAAKTVKENQCTAEIHPYRQHKLEREERTPAAAESEENLRIGGRKRKQRIQGL
jgi:hypothetical protein